MYVEKLIKICETILGHGPTEQAWFEYGVSLYRVARLRRDGLWFRQALRIFESLSKNPEKREFYAEIIRNIHEQLSAL